MPTYDYVCKSCDYEFELFQPITAPVKRKCPECGNLKLERLIGTGAGIIFKGSGFYQTDYRSDSYSKDAKADKENTVNKSSSTSDNNKDSKTKKTESDSGKTKSHSTETPISAGKKNKSQTDKAVS